MSVIDIAIPSYNYGRYLRACVESVTSQGVEGMRILIIDNASTDNSAEIARGLAATDPRIELRLRERNLGPHASFNEAVDWARSRYFVILCADDLLLQGSLARFIAALEKDREANLAYGSTLFLEHPGDATPQEAGSACQAMSGRQLLEAFCLSGRNPINGPMAVTRTSIQKRVGYYNADLPHTDDAEMWMRFALTGGAVAFPDPMSITRIHGANQSRVLSTVHHWNTHMEAAFDSFFLRYGKEIPDARRLHGMARRSLSDRAYWCAVSNAVRGEPGAAQLLGFAFRLRPASLVVPPVNRLWRDSGAWQRAVSAILRKNREAPGAGA